MHTMNPFSISESMCGHVVIACDITSSGQLKYGSQWQRNRFFKQVWIKAQLLTMSACSSQSAAMTLTEADIPGAYLEEPFDQYTISQLRW